MSTATLERILIVEDDPGVALLQRRRLERAGYTAVTAGTTDEAMAIITAGGIELVLLDYRLPGDVNGLDFYGQLMAAGYDLPVIVVTGFSDEATVIQALRVGVRDFVTKSVEYLDYLPEAVHRVLERERIKDRLVQSEARLREQATLLDKARDAILVLDLEDRIQFWNHGAERLYGWSADEAVGRSCRELLDQESSPWAEEADHLVLQTGEWSGELRQKTRKGQNIMVESRWTLIHDDEGRAKSKLVINSDITEKKTLQTHLLHAQRMEAVGALAGGVAHEFNNLLQAIHGYTTITLDGLCPTEQRFQDLQQVLKAAERASGLTRQLLGFGRRQMLSPTHLAPNGLVHDLIKMLRPLIGAHIELETRLGQDVGTLYADVTLLQQMLMNLCVNARDAMPDGGKLVIKTEAVTLSEEYCASHINLKPGRYVLFTVADTGCGMTADVRDRIFEPFFTTKAVGRGTGLGLAMVYGVVQQHGGAIHVYSEPEMGTTFRLYLPTVNSAAEASADEEAAPAAGGSETILIAEDEPLVRELAVRILHEAGYRTITASDGEQAVRVYEAQGREIDLALLDVVMPKLNGRMVCHAIRGMDPEAKVLFCSGYDAETSCGGFVSGEGLTFVQKPFQRQELLRAVRGALDEEALCSASQ
ncbi:MAG: response regulator [Planctomycetes bacterium]|nr:response regulator [Planctomycetota bacterium]